MTEPKTIGESADQFTPKTVKNITELDKVDVRIVLHTETGTDKDGVEYTYNFIEVNDVKYRVPATVLKDLKEIRKKKPSLTTFSVSKSGQGRDTRYTVIPLD